MSEFLLHTSCPHCGSSDARAVYLGGSSWCFSCHRYTRGEINANSFSTEKRTIKEVRPLPEDLGQAYGPEAIAWTSSYQIKTEELLRNDVYYSERQRRLYFIWRDGEERICAWQARNFISKPKYISSGSLEEVYPIYYCKEAGQDQMARLRHRRVSGFSRAGTLVLTEDCLSAIKIARQSDAMPCLTSTLSPTKLNRLVRLYGAFLVWLDGNMFDKAQAMARQLQVLGANARAVYTPLDPKCYNDEEIGNICKDA